MKKTMALFTIAGLSMASELDSVADNDLHLYKLQNGLTALVQTVDDELRVLPIDYHPGSSNGPRVIFTDDELRVLPINYHPPRSRPSGGIWTDDELRILPIDHHTRPNTKPSKPIMADDDELLTRAIPLEYLQGGTRRPRAVFAEDDEMRILSVGHHSGPQKSHTVSADDDDYELRALLNDYIPGGIRRPRTVFAEDDEMRVLPIDYHPGSHGGPRFIYADGDEELRLVDIGPGGLPHKTHTIENPKFLKFSAQEADDDEFRFIPSAYSQAMSKYGKKDKKPVSEETVQNDDELRLVDIGPGGLPHKKHTIETPKLAKLNIKEADDADNELLLYKLQNGLTALVHTVDDELRVLPIDYHPPRPRPSGGIWTDDELRILPIDHHTRPNTKPNKPIMADDELRLVAVGPGSLTHKKNTTEPAKPIEVKPKRSTTGALKLNTTISNSAADDEMRFAHFIPQYRPQREDVEKKATDNTLVDLSELLVESQREGGFLERRRR